MKGAVLSPCRLYRYTLTRDTGSGFGTVNFVMLNPSTADAEVDDPTIRRCIGYSKAWGYRYLVVTNLFALRSTKPAALKAASDPVGPENDQHLTATAQAAWLVVCAWGAGGALLDRDQTVRALLAGVPLHFLRLTAAGHPGHPLYLPASLRPQRWAYAG